VSTIVFEHVDFARGAQTILNDVSFTIDSGEAVALVGRSGAGKSTALKLMNRLLEPASGRVLVHGKETRQWDPFDLRRRTGYVLQEIALFPHMTIGENVGIVPRLLGWDKMRVQARVDELLGLVDLPASTYAARMPSELSGGQRQRVGVARALAADPPVLLMDEPFGALDPITRRELRDAFRAIQQRLKKTVVIVTHDMHEALSLGDRVGVLADGRLHTIAAPEHLRQSDDPHIRDLLATEG
jgi:osmoprotectant transport system ATP-binding protein